MLITCSNATSFAECIVRSGWIRLRKGCSFRGFIAAASLKPHSPVPFSTNSPCFPRLHRRGLIEAHRYLTAMQPIVAFPRLHRRGLIEAGRLACSVVVG